MNAHQLVLVVLAPCLAAPVALADSVVYLGADERSGSSRAVVVAGHALAHTGQLLPLDKEGNLIGGNSVDAQLAQVLFNLEAALAAAGSGTDHLVKLNLYVDSAGTADRARGLFAKRFRKPVLPAMSWVCTPLAHPKARVGLDAVAVVPEAAGGGVGRPAPSAVAAGSGDPRRAQPGDAHRAPAIVLRKRCEALAGDARVADVAILPCGEAVYVSGIPEKGEMAAATAKAVEGLLRTIGHLKLDRSHVVQLKAFLNSMREADVVKQEIAKVFAGQPAPPLVLVEWVSKTPIEIEMIAVGPTQPPVAAGLDTVTYFTPPEVKASPLYSRVARVHADKRIYISGLYADQPGSGEAQVRSIFAALEAIAKESGSDLRHLVKATCYVSDEDAGAAHNRLRPEYFDPQRPPAASKATVKEVGMSGRSISMDMIAVPAR